MKKTALLMGLMLIPTLGLAQAPAPAAPRPANAPAPDPEPTNITSAAATLAASPKANIGNGVLKATIALPDKDKGFYRGTRFDWAGMVSSVTYGDQEYYGLWFDEKAPNIRDFVFYKGKVVASPQTSALGPVDAYDALGYAEAPVGGTFVKVGVGVMRKADDQPYNQYRSYEIVDHGNWQSRASATQVEFTQTIKDPASGYGYTYKKVVRLVAGKPVMELAHSLTNPGTKPFVTTSFNHNFLTFGGAPTGPGLKVTASNPLAASPAPNTPAAETGEVTGNTVTYKRAVTGEDRFSNGLASATPTADKYDFSVMNAKGAGYRVTSNYPLARATLWSMVRTVAVEPFVRIELAPGQSTDWTFTYTYTRAGGARVAQN